MMTSVESFIHSENIKNFKKRLESATDDAQRKALLTLLAEEEVRAGEEIGACWIDTTYGSIEVPQANLAAPSHLLLGV